MQKLKGITKVIGFVLKYAPVIFVIIEALEMIKTKISELETPETLKK